MNKKDVALKLAVLVLEKIVDDKNNEGQTIGAYRILAQVTLAQINALLGLDIPEPAPSDEGELLERMG